MMNALRVVAIEKIIGPLGVAAFRPGPVDVCRSAEGELLLVPHAAVDTFNPQHQ
jgi:hypothetical protein